MIRMCHYVTHYALLMTALLIPHHTITADSAIRRSSNSVIQHSNVSSVMESDLDRIEQQILVTRNQLTQVSAELRDAKVLAAEKMMEYEITRDAFQREQNAVSANSLDHAQQRLALAEMGVESKAARFERIQRKLKELADAKQEILAEPPTVAQTENLDARNDDEQKRKDTTEKSVVIAPASTSPASLDPNSSSPEGQLAPLPLVKKLLQQGSEPAPVLTQQGKVSDIYQLNAELQKLEHHLVNHGTGPTEPIQVKIYGTAIAGEIPLTEMGGNQFFARFAAPAGTASIIIGARHPDGYVRTELQMTFLPEEKGKDFVLIFDINTKEQPRALVFQESLAFTQEMFASHNDF